ncbi:MAG: hypothetical protein NTZ15_13655 [Burkholderiales bacterium]|nr:hypothetical protein [Burkholderiales bacterium]
MHQQIRFNGNIRRVAIILASIFLAVHGAEYLDAEHFFDSQPTPAEQKIASPASKPITAQATDAALQKKVSLK